MADFVGEHEVCEDGAAAGCELLCALRVDEPSEEVGGQEVGRELHARELCVEQLCECLYGERLCKSGKSFEQDVSVGKQAYEECIYEVALADDGLCHTVAQGA